MFDDLTAGRRIFVGTSFTEDFRGTIERVTDTHVRLRDFEVVGPDATGAPQFHPAEGIARIPRTSITWIQEL